MEHGGVFCYNDEQRTYFSIKYVEAQDKEGYKDAPDLIVEIVSPALILAGDTCFL